MGPAALALRGTRFRLRIEPEPTQQLQLRQHIARQVDMVEAREDIRVLENQIET